MAELEPAALLDMTVGIVANFVANNAVPPQEVADLISTTHAALVVAGSGIIEPEPVQVDQPSAAQIRRSISDKGIVSFLDGRTYQSLNRHLRTNGYTPQAYRQAYGLPSDYPIVSPAYAARRSALAKAAGLGKGGRKPPVDKAGRKRKTES